MRYLKYISIFLISFLIKSCTKDVDFDQIDDASIKTEYISTLVYFNLTATNFLDEFNNEITSIGDIIDAPISDESQDYLEKIEFTIITENSFDRDFLVQIAFFDKNNTLIYTLQPDVYIPANTTTLTTIIEIPETDIDVIYNTEYFGFILSLLPSSDGSVISNSDTSTLNLKSSAKLFFNFRKI
ncbi:hypothetical protein [Lutibacter sp. B1]|jgi:hypothetical protein|uniref:hypothetical protein n=1 Tax=Lutibacter sp. B1 TaxID=2725996 RepID=UPI001457534D|nr:hypothetical protein [Lutibacter sp. B1]NLP58788.1 hypothetical protein [Lutibacter sp. B1]